MTSNEFGTLAAALKTFYPKDNLLPTDKAIELWYEELKDIDYTMAEAQIRKHVATNKYPPTISDIRACLADFSPEIHLWTTQAWELVLNALEDVEMHGNGAKKFSALPQTVQKTIGGVKQFCDMIHDKDIKRIEYANFLRTYPVILEMEKQKKMLNPDIRKMLERAEQDSVPQIEEKEEEEELIGDEWVDL